MEGQSSAIEIARCKIVSVNRPDIAAVRGDGTINVLDDVVFDQKIAGPSGGNAVHGIRHIECSVEIAVSDGHMRCRADEGHMLELHTRSGPGRPDGPEAFYHEVQCLTQHIQT